MVNCPLPFNDYPAITLAHGGGGSLMHRLLEKLIIPSLENGTPLQRHDGAVLESGGKRIAFTTDSYVVRPLFFPGGDIGKLAVHGTVNDLAMCGAEPKYLSCALIIEEGLPVETLSKVLHSMREAAREAGVDLVTGDTKVVDRGKGDGLYINTAGIGFVADGISIGPNAVQVGDAILINGDLGRHGIAIMAVREGLQFESEIESDTAPLWSPVHALLKEGIDVHCLRDLTRGGLSSTLNEIADTAKARIAIDEAAISVREDVRGACEMLGLDPLYVANEGRFCAFVKAADASKALEILKRNSPESSLIGHVESRGKESLVALKNRLGSTRILDMMSGEQLPRIC